MSQFGFTVSQADTVIFCLCLIIGLLGVSLVSMIVSRHLRAEKASQELEDVLEMAWASGVSRDKVITIVDEIYRKENILIARAQEDEDNDTMFSKF